MGAIAGCYTAKSSLNSLNDNQMLYLGNRRMRVRTSRIIHITVTLNERHGVANHQNSTVCSAVYFDKKKLNRDIPLLALGPRLIASLLDNSIINDKCSL